MSEEDTALLREIRDLLKIIVERLPRDIIDRSS
jgi:hypothetical protein